MPDSNTPLSMQLVRPSRFQAWLFVAGCGFSSMVGAMATAISMKPATVVVRIADEHEKTEKVVEYCDSMDIHSVLPRERAQEWFARNRNGDARLVPAIVSNEYIGLKLYAIRSESIYDVMGLRNGDTIHRVAGVSLTSPDAFGHVRQIVRADDLESISIVLNRRGCPASLTATLL